MNLEVRWVEDLLTLERERSISKAAEKRFIRVNLLGIISLFLVILACLKL